MEFDFKLYDDKEVNPKLLTTNSFILKNQNNQISTEFLNEDEYVDLEFFSPKALIDIVSNNFSGKKGLLIHSPLS